MSDFESIFQQACLHKGSEQSLLAELPRVASAAELAEIDASEYLSVMTKRIFQVGFNWSVVEKKWPGFEAAFHQFDIGYLLMLPDEEYEPFRHDTRIIRNFTKIMSIKKNAQFIDDIEQQHGRFGEWLAQWPVTDQIGLLDVLQKRGNRLGGMTGGYLLRSVGKDAFLITPDVVTALKNANVIGDQNPSTKKARQQIQAAFNTWHEQTKLPMSHISKVLACSIGSGI